MYHYLVIITGVSYKKYRKTLGKRAKRHYFLYYYDQNGVFCSKRCSKIEAWFRKFQKKKRFKYTCPSCDRSFMAINQKKKDIKCPYCDWLYGIWNSSFRNCPCGFNDYGNLENHIFSRPYKRRLTIIFFFEHINSSYYHNIHWLDVDEDVQQEQEPSHDVDGAVLKNVLANQSSLTGRK